MGVSFGQIPGGSSVLRGVSDARGSQPPARLIPPAVQNIGGQREGSVENAFRSTSEPAPQVGLGEGSVGGTPAAALAALGQTVESVRENTPTIDQIRAGFRQRAEAARARVRSELRAEALAQVVENETEPTEAVERPPSFEAREFLTALDTVDRAIQERPAAPVNESVEAPPAPEPAAQSQAPEPQPRPERFDVTV